MGEDFALLIIISLEYDKHPALFQTEYPLLA